MKKKLLLSAISILLLFLFSPFGFYQTKFKQETIVTLPLTQLVMEGTIEELDSVDAKLLFESMGDYVTLESLDEIPIVTNFSKQDTLNKNVIPILTEETNKSSKIWAFMYQKSKVSNQYEIDLPLTHILYKGKLILFKGSGNISINGDFEVLGLCSLGTYNQLLENSLEKAFRKALQQELKRKILTVLN
ncbi:hypothetical protein [Echinicola jeungdonensis]